MNRVRSLDDSFRLGASDKTPGSINARLVQLLAQGGFRVSHLSVIARVVCFDLGIDYMNDLHM